MKNPLSTGTSRTRKVLSHKNTKVNEEGEVLEEQAIFIEKLVKGQQDWFTMFAAHLGRVLHLDGNEIKVLLWCAMNAHLNKAEIALNKHTKQCAANECGIHFRSIENAITKLCKKKMLVRLCQGQYMIDPDTTWRGSVNKRSEAISVYVKYTLDSPDGTENGIGGPNQESIFESQKPQ